MPQIHTKRVDTQGELLVCNDLLSRGYEVFTPVGDYTVIDIVAIKDKHILRLQVKTNVDTSKGWMCIGASRGQNRQRVEYQHDDFDYIAGCALDRNVVVYVPLSRLMPHNPRSIVLRFEVPERKGSVNLVSDFQSLAPVV